MSGRGYFFKRYISIHAPVKGATSDFFTKHDDKLISIHAPVKGATLDQGDGRLSVAISIHAPVKGATNQLNSGFDAYKFQSTLP